MQAIEDISNVMSILTQHESLNIRVMSNGRGAVPADVMERIMKPHRKLHYFFSFVKKGSSVHKVDLKDVEILPGQSLFILPHQIHQLMGRNTDIEYYKICFDDTCIALLPRSFPFLVNPYNKQLIDFDAAAGMRISAVFETLIALLGTRTGSRDIIAAHLHTLLAEFDHAYFKNAPAGDAKNGLPVFVAFKQLVEDELTEQPGIEDIAARLLITSNSLYALVKKFTGQSPKEYITNRLVLEAQRRLYYSETTVKNLAYDLGFTDPDYFSRLFKKSTGKSITQYLDSIQETSGI